MRKRSTTHPSAMVALPRSLQTQLVDYGRELAFRGSSGRSKLGGCCWGWPAAGLRAVGLHSPDQGAAGSPREPSPDAAVLGLTLWLNIPPAAKALSPKASFLSQKLPFAPRQRDVLQAKSRALLTHVCKSKDKARKL